MRTETKISLYKSSSRDLEATLTYPTPTTDKTRANAYSKP